MIDFRDDRIVWVACSAQKHYGRTVAADCLRNLFEAAGMDATHAGTAAWNPLGELIRPGARVLLKPNWVLDQNAGGQGLDCLITHPSVIAAVLEYAVRAQPAQICVADAPIQGCDFQRLLASCKIREVIDGFRGRGPEIDVRDLRMTVRQARTLEADSEPTGRTLSDYVLFDLGKASLLEEITSPNAEFRVTMYDPDALSATHTTGRHQYLIARELVEADVVLNLPKLKTHKKAGMTGALKNMIGVNGHKQYLPHHRKGGKGVGDCYENASPWKILAENSLDSANRSQSSGVRRLYGAMAGMAVRVSQWTGGDRNLEGAWHGNDTIWRTALDLQMILHFGRSDGTMAQRPQRSSLSITDAIVAGEGEGPLSPDPALLGMITMARNPAAADWMGAFLLGLDPSRIPLCRRAFKTSLCSFRAEEVVAHDGVREMSAMEFAHRFPHVPRPPLGWRQSVELKLAEAALC